MATATEALGATRTLRLLVVDDQVDCADGLGQLLNLSGHHAEVAYSAQQALDVARLCPLDVILLDLMMPGMDGYALARALRERIAEPRPILIAVTAHGDKRARERSLEFGIDFHLVKPIDWTRLEDLLIVVAGR